MSRRRWLAALLTTWLSLLAAPAAAQVARFADAAFSVERFLRPPGPNVYWTTQGADVLPHLAWWMGVAGTVSSRPLVLEDLRDGEEATVPVRTRVGYEFAAAVGLGNKVELGVVMPVVAAQAGDGLMGTDLDNRFLAPIALGDLRLHGTLRIAGARGGLGRSAAVAVSVSLPTGDEGSFAGEKGAIYSASLIGAWRSRRVSIAANLGVRVRSQEVVFLAPSRPHGNELTAGVAAETLVPLPGLARDHLSAVAEYVMVRGATGTNDSVRGPSPQEMRVGGRWRYASGATVGLGVGWGVTPEEVGSPAWRVFVTAGFTSVGHMADLDRDGVPDRVDRCRSVAEDLDGFEDLDGCPERDNDGDGIDDQDDECPNAAEDLDGWRDLDGCPDDQSEVGAASAGAGTGVGTGAGAVGAASGGAAGAARLGTGGPGGTPSPGTFGRLCATTSGDSASRNASSLRRSAGVSTWGSRVRSMLGLPARNPPASL